MTRVVHVSPATFGRRGLYGGGERYVIELAKAMNREVPTSVVTFGEAFSSGVADDVDVRVLKTRTHWRGAEVNPISERLAWALRDADVVHVHQWDSVVANACVVLAGLRRRPVFATDHGGSGRNYWRRLRLDRRLTGFLAVSSFGAGFYPELAAKTRVVFGGTDTERFAPGSGRRVGAVAVGRVLPHKGIDLVIRGLRPDIPLVVLGRRYDESYADLLTRLAKGKEVTFRSAADDATLVTSYQSSLVSVLASQYQPTVGPRAAKPELLGLALLEAMACGTPVVATDVGGMPEVVQDGVVGRIVAAGSAEEIGSAVAAIVDDRAGWAAMSTAARAHVVQEFTWDATARRCLAAYRSMAAL